MTKNTHTTLKPVTLGSHRNITSAAISPARPQKYKFLFCFFSPHVACYSFKLNPLIIVFTTAGVLISLPAVNRSGGVRSKVLPVPCALELPVNFRVPTTPSTLLTSATEAPCGTIERPLPTPRCFAGITQKGYPGSRAAELSRFNQI